MTYLQLVNAVLTRLRQGTVTAVSQNEYSTLIGQFVNEAKREVEDAWNWSHLRAFPTVATVNDGTQTYSINNTNERTRIMSAYNTTKKWELLRYQQNYSINQNNLNPVYGSTTHFDVIGIDTASSDKLKIRVWPLPNTVETLTFFCVVPQADLSGDSDALLVPADPVIQLAYLLAINERGEDQGRLSEIQAERFTTSLGNHIAIDANKFEDEITWQAI